MFQCTKSLMKSCTSTIPFFYFFIHTNIFRHFYEKFTREFRTQMFHLYLRIIVMMHITELKRVQCAGRFSFRKIFPLFVRFFIQSKCHYTLLVIVWVYTQIIQVKYGSRAIEITRKYHD